MLLRSLSIAMSLIALAGSGAAAHDAGLVPVAGDAGSAARLPAVFGTVTSIHRTVERNRLVGGVRTASTCPAGRSTSSASPA